MDFNNNQQQSSSVDISDFVDVDEEATNPDVADLDPTNPVNPSNPVVVNPAPVAPPVDPVVATIQQRASELSYALKPQAIARKLHDELKSIAGDKAHLYYIGASTTDGENLKFEIAKMSPNLAVRLGTAYNTKSGDFTPRLSVAYQSTTKNGWEVAVGVSVGLTSLGSVSKPSDLKIIGSFEMIVSK